MVAAVVVVDSFELTEVVEGVFEVVVVVEKTVAPFGQLAIRVVVELQYY